VESGDFPVVGNGAAAGVFNPMLAGAGMAFSSVTGRPPSPVRLLRCYRPVVLACPASYGSVSGRR
jgi:hypothetical protein